MREILFRAKTTDTNEWAIGYYDGYGLSPSISINPDDVFCNVDSETLGQFTGRYDKDGVRIFEGDILQFSRSISLEGENLTLELPHQLFLVKWIKGISGFLGISDWSSTEDEVPMGIYSLVWGKGEVIGNIYDNPELLNEEVKKVKKNIYKCCKNCKYWIGKDELEIGRCTKHDCLMWGTADACKGFGLMKEGENEQA